MNTKLQPKAASRKDFMANNFSALLHLLLPAFFALTGLLLSVSQNIFLFIAGQLLLGIFFFQCFILLHETGHYSFFPSKALNRLAGHIFGVFSFIPFESWVSVHNLHHKWTGWRDKDPTTEGTVSPKFSKPIKAIVNVSWKIGFPLFTIGYRLGNYWSHKKLKKYLNPDKLKKAYINQFLLVGIYFTLFLFFGKWLLVHLGIAYFISLMISDIIILSQHSHIEIPVSNGQEVKPISYQEQIPYTRSILFNKFIAKYLLLNFNLHELHHAYPGTPAYHLHKHLLKTPNARPFMQYILKAKKMSGEKFVFNTSKSTGIEV
ncbi:MAG: fatty acid desaturase [Bacteroidetes bacterium]|nr:fatty acid desaturase [Bacteroidota bacterium]